MLAPARIDYRISTRRVHEAYADACRAIFNTRVESASAARDRHGLWLSFAAHYRRLVALPRRTRRSMQRKWKHTLGAIALLMTLGQAPAWAATIEVTPGMPPSIKPDGRCSLIEAIVNANRDRRTHLDCVAGSGGDTILLPAKSIQGLRSAERLPEITSRIIIEGRSSTIRRNTTEPSYLSLVNVAASGDLTLNRVTLAGSTSGYAYDHGIRNLGRITLNASAILGSAGMLNSGGVAVLQGSRVTGTRPDWEQLGGGISNVNGSTLVVRNSVISGNDALQGGGIDNDASSKATLVDSIVADNEVFYGDGGGICNRGSLLVVGTTITNNAAYGGGGISNHVGGSVTVQGSTISGNIIKGSRSYSGGGGISNGGTLQILNSTVSNNGSGASFRGGGVSSGCSGCASVARLTILDSTVSGNSSLGYLQEGGGLYVGSGTLTLKRSIVSGNYGVTREIDVKPGVNIVADEFNVLGHDGDAGLAGFVPGSTDIVPNEPISGILLPLADNGGGTQTHALAIGSPALDASPDDVTCPATDQRGNPRPRGPACDIGAFEGVAVLCNGKVTTMVGTVNDDRLTGTAGPDVISGLLGNDTVDGLGGNDVVCAGSGNDILYGGPGADLLLGEPGDDRLFGQGGNDTLNGGAGKDACDGGPGAGDAATTCETVKAVP